MIYYFSGTGNSRWAAGQLAAKTGDQAYNICDLLDDKKWCLTVKKGEAFGLVFPVYGWSPPLVVLDWLKNITFEEGAYCYAVCTCGQDCGLTMNTLSRRLPLTSAFSLLMPENYITLFKAESPQKICDKIAAATIRLEHIAKAILGRKTVFDVNQGKLPAFKSRFISPIFNAFFMNDRKFYATSNCNGCGLCAQICPLKNIELNDGKPCWQGNCTRCMACICRCPVLAIEYGNKTRGKDRYVFPSVRSKQESIL